MPLTEEERKAIVVYRMEKAEGALAANRLYYAAHW